MATCWTTTASNERMKPDTQAYTLFVLPPIPQVESAYQQHLMRGEATEELLQMGQTNAALDILAQK